MEKSTQKSFVSVFSSSHGVRRHHFPNNFNWHFFTSERFYYRPENYSRGGKRMSTGEMNLIIKVARQKSPAKHYVVLNMGTNNIRNDGEHPEDLLCYFKEIAEELGTIPNCHLVLVSLVPSFARNEELKNEFWRLSQHFQAMAKLYPHVSWCNWVRQLYSNGKLDPQHFEDDVHLSQSGAVIFTNALIKHLSYLP